MMTQKTGALIFDETADRYDIRFDVNDYYGACIAATAWRSLCGANGSLPVWSTGTTGILWVFGRQTFPGCEYGFNRAA